MATDIKDKKGATPNGDGKVLPQYVCVGNVIHDGVEYAPGDAIDLDEATAEKLLIADAIMIGVAATPEQTPAE